MKHHLAAALLVLSCAADAAPPPGATGQFKGFFQGLTRPDVGGSCCDESDCRITKSRIGKKGYEAMNQFGEWVEVPENKIIRGKENPTGEPVLCYLPSIGVLCFLAGIEG